MGRITTFTPEIGEEIVEHVSSGKTLRSFCDRDGRPSYGTVFDWLEQHADFATAYARARERQAHNDADRINDVLERCEQLQLPPDVTRVIVDGLKWTAARRHPKAYSERPPPGSDDGRPLVVRWADGSD